MTSPAIIIPKQETSAVMRGRALLLQITDRVLELHDKGKNPVRARISSALADDLRAYLDFNFVWDGVLPREYHGLVLEYVPGADRRVEIVCAG